MVGRALSRGRFEHRSPVLDSPTTEAYRSGGGGTLRATKKHAYPPLSTPARADLYAPPPRSPLDPGPAARARSRFGREASRGRERDASYDYDDRRDPVSEGRTTAYGRAASASAYGGRAASALRGERFDDDESQGGGGASSAHHAREVLSKLRAGGRGGGERGLSGGSREASREALERERGLYTDPALGPLGPSSLAKPSLRGTARQVSGLSDRSPRRRLDLPHLRQQQQHEDEADLFHPQQPPPIPHRQYPGDQNRNDMNIVPASRYEVLGMKEELKKKDTEAQGLRRDLDDLAARKEAEVQDVRRSLDDLARQHEEDVAAMRSKLVSTFKEDMQEMKTEWEEAFKRLKDESDAAQRVLEDELVKAEQGKAETEAEMADAKAELRQEMADAKAELRGQMEDEKAELRGQMEDEKERALERMEELKRSAQERMEELKRSKEEDLERLRSMYEEHLDGTKKAAGDVEGELKEEIHVLLDENEKVKRCYEDLEAELSRCKGELEQLNASYQQVLGDGLQREKEVAAYKEELNDANLRREKEAASHKQELDDVHLRREKEVASYKGELDDVLDENDKQVRRNQALSAENAQQVRRNEALAAELAGAREELERSASQYQRSQAERSRFEQEWEAASKEREEVSREYEDLVKKLDAIQEERTLEGRYTEALVNQRDNMNAIIENGQAEIEELKGMIEELRAVHQGYEHLSQEFHLKDGEAATIREELVKSQQFMSLAKEFHTPSTSGGGKNGDNDDAAVYSSVREELVKAQQYAALAKDLRLPNNNGGDGASVLRDEFAKSSAALRDEVDRSGKMKERLDTLGRERERYNATVKALKFDLKALHGANVGVETSLQEHMRLLNEKWDANEAGLAQIDKLRNELEESVQLLEENAKERERSMKEHHERVDSLQRDLRETQAALVKTERDKIATGNRLSDVEALDAKKKQRQEELEAKCGKLEDRLAYVDNEWQEREAQCKSLEGQCKSLESDKRLFDAELEKFRLEKNELEDALDKAGGVKKGLKKKLESAYFDLEETQRELSSMRNNHEDELRKFEAELSGFSKQNETINSQDDEIKSLKDIFQRTQQAQDEEIKSLKDTLRRAQQEQVKDLEDTQAEVAESYKVQIRLLEDKHADQERCNTEYAEQKHRSDVEELSNKMEGLRNKVEELRSKNKQLERSANEQKEHLDQKSMAEIKRRGEFAKQKQELEILRSKERHLETHVNQLEEHISRVVADYETKLQSSNITTCSVSNSAEDKAKRKQVRELEKKLEVSSAAMKQIGKSSLLMEKENERLKQDKNELKLKLKKLVDCAEKFGPR